MEGILGKSSWLANLAAVILLFAGFGCKHTENRDLTAPEAVVELRFAPLRVGEFRVLRELVESTAESRSTPEFQYHGPVWQFQGDGAAARQGACRVRFYSERLNRAGVLVRSESVVAVLKDRLKREGLSGRVVVGLR